MDGQTRRPFRQFQIRVDVAGQTQDVSFGVEQGRRRGVAPQQQGFGQAFGVRDVGYGSPPGQIKVAPGHSGEPGGQVGRQGGRGGFAAEKTPFLVDDLEQAGMMESWGVPSVLLHAKAREYAAVWAASGHRVVDLALAGGFAREEHIFKALALGAPFAKLVCMDRLENYSGCVDN